MEFEITMTKELSFPIISVKGYFNAEAGAQLNSVADELLRKGTYHFAVDFSACDLVNSPGIGALLDLTLKTTEDFRGTLVLVSLTPLMRESFSLACILPKARVAADVPEALNMLLADRP